METNLSSDVERPDRGASGRGQPIAIVGIGCRLPGGIETPSALWSGLRAGVDLLEPRDEPQPPRFGDERGGPAGRGRLGRVDMFDREAFGLSRRDAVALDPQQRLLLEVASEALEDAGDPHADGRGRNAGVYVSLIHEDYRALQLRRGPLDLAREIGTSRGGGSGLISHAFGLTGPSLTVDSDRASSLVAVDLAVRALRAGQCELALVGAANLILCDELTQAFERAGLLARDGRVKFGDRRADGFVRSEAVLAVVLAPLESARRDARRVYALIRGTAVRHAGASGKSYLAPSPEAYAESVRAALADADVPGRAVGYVEAHGAGTTVGDPLELQALGSAYGQSRSPEAPLWIGSVKSNLGHTEAASGLAGLIKTALALSHAEIPGSLHCERPVDALSPGALLRVPSSVQPFASVEAGPGLDAWRGARFAGVSSIGLTGTVAHAILQADDGQAPSGADECVVRPLLLPLSARTAGALEALARDVLVRLGAAPEHAAAYCRAFGQRRAHYAQRLAVTGATPAELIAALRQSLDGAAPATAARGRVENSPVAGNPVASNPVASSPVASSPVARERRLVFVFPGQGSQWRGMGLGLLEAEPVFRNAFERCDDIVQREAGFSLLRALREGLPDAEGAGAGDWDDIAVVQPLLVAFEISLALLLVHWGIVPHAVVGASMGEVAAAYVAGALSLADALAVVCRRSRRLARETDRGRMAVVECAPEEARQAVLEASGRVAVAGVHSPRSVVLGGEPGALARVLAAFESRGTFVRYVNVRVASHTPLVAEAARDLVADLQGLAALEPQLPLYSTVTGQRLQGAATNAEHWGRGVSEPVLLSAVVQRLVEDGYTTFLEVSPHPVLLSALLDNLEGSAPRTRALRTLKRGAPEQATLLESVAACYAQGHGCHWEVVQGPGSAGVELPRHPFQRERCWFEPGQPSAASVREAPCAGEPEATASPSASVSASAVGAVGARAVEAVVEAAVNRVLGGESASVDRRATFRDLGFTSLMLTELRAALAVRFERSLPASSLFEHPSIEQLSRHLAGASADVAREAAPEPSRVEPSTGAAFEGSPEGAVAVIGIACRFPGADGLGAFWQLLATGTDAVTEIPSERWDAAQYYDPDPDAPGKTCSRWAGSIGSVAGFDASFFGIAAREAEAMDPQQRLLLELSHEALEHAGLRIDRLASSKTGVFVGMSNTNDYATLKGHALDPSSIDAHDSTGNAASIAAGRLAYQFGLEGPCLTVDTACSSSLVAVHLALQSLRLGESELALAAGVNLILSPEPSIAYAKTRMLSPSGRCRTFDAGADGYVRGEGCAVVVLKRVADARRDRDTIWAVLRGSAVNQDGRSNGLTAPNPRAQQRLIEAAVADAGIAAADIDYLECHGTGTPLGDPVELRAAHAALGDRPGRPALVVGSVKTNIGHLEAAAGLAGLIKVVLSMRAGVVPRHLHFEALNPEIAQAGGDFVVPVSARAWPLRAGRRWAGVSSFGFSGTNAHVVIESAPPEAAVAGSTPCDELLSITARSAAALEALVARHAEALGSLPEAAWGDYARSAALAREPLEHRISVVSSSAAAACAALRGESSAATAVFRGQRRGRRPRVAFLFTGQGSQYARMGSELAASQPVFRAALERCSELAEAELGCSLTSLFTASSEAWLREPALVQPALFALQFALVEQWRAWGVEPDAVLGHSLGEYAACVASGALSLESALRLVIGRGRLISRLAEPGVAAAAWLGAEQVEPLIEPYRQEAALAAHNAPSRVLIAGRAAAVEAIVARVRAQGAEAKRLDGVIGVHSPMMDPVLDELARLGESVPFSAPRVPLVSGLTGDVTSAHQLASPDYWRRHAREPVRFMQGVRRLVELGSEIFVEIGPRHTLVRLAEACVPEGFAGAFLPSLSKERKASRQFLESAAALHARGVDVDLAALHPGGPRPRLPLPSYPFQRQRYWLRSRPQGGSAPLAGSRGLLGVKLRSSLADAQYEALRSEQGSPSISGHRLFGARVVPAAAYVARALEGARAEGWEPVELRQVVFRAPLILAAGEERSSHLVLGAPDGGERTFRISSCPAHEQDAVFTLHASGTVARVASDAAAPHTPAAVEPGENAESGEAFYARQAAMGYGLEGALRCLDEVWVQGEQARLELAPRCDGPEALVGVLDACFQAATRLAAPPSPGELLVPVSIERLRVDSLPGRAPLSGWVRRVGLNPRGDVTVDLELASGGLLVASASGLTLRRVAKHDVLPVEPSASTEEPSAAPLALSPEVYHVEWVADEGAAPLAQEVGAGAVLIFAEPDPLARALAAELESCGRRCLLVSAGSRAEPSAGGYRIAPERRGDYQQAFAFARERFGGVSAAVALPSVDPGAPGSSLASADLRSAPGSAIARLSCLCSVLEQVSPAPDAWVVTRGAHPIEPSDGARGLSASCLWGAGRVWARELLGGSLGLIDIGVDADAELAAAGLVREMARGARGARELALRGGWRLVPRLVPAAPNAERARVSPDATYLISGGLGGLGPDLARHLIGRGARNVGLIARAPRPDAAARIAELERLGARVRLIAADVTRYDQVAAGCAALARELPPVAGVFHAAGTLIDAPARELRPEQMAAVLAPKVLGALHLHRALDAVPLDFFVVFSSIVGLIGNEGQLAYAAANTFLDRFALERSRSHGRTLSVGFGPFHGAGMAERQERELRRRWGLLGLEREAAFDRLLERIAAGDTHAALLALEPRTLPTFGRGLLDSIPVTKGATASARAGGSAAPARDTLDGILAVPPSERTTRLLDHVREVIVGVLGGAPAAELFEEQRLEELGVDSLLSTDIAKALQVSLGMRLPQRVVFDHPTLGGLVGYLANELQLDQNERARAPMLGAAEAE